MKAGNYNIRWGYDSFFAEESNPFSPHPLMKHITWCDIVIGERVIAEGDTTCSTKDHFCRDTGRKISLGRAMKNANLPKEERTVIWELYRNMTPKKRW